MGGHVVMTPDSPGDRKRTFVPDPAAGWRWLGWFGLVLALLGLGDIALAWYPLDLGNPQWEFGTVAATFQGLPIVAIGLAGLLGAGLAQGKRRLVATLVAVLLCSSVLLLAASVLFLLDVPLAVQATQSVARLAIKKAVVKTLMLGWGFAATFAAGAVAAWRQLRRRGEG